MVNCFVLFGTKQKKQITAEWDVTTDEVNHFKS